jgi:hypothetical protein
LHTPADVHFGLCLIGVERFRGPASSVTPPWFTWRVDVLETLTVGQAVALVRRGLDRLSNCDPVSLSDPESITEVHHLSACLEGVRTAAVAEFEAGGEWAVDGAKSTAAWLATRCHLPMPEAKRVVRRARTLPHLPLAKEALMDGDIGAAQFDALAKVRTPVTEVAFARDEALLVGHAKEMKFEPLVRLLAFWEQHADPDGADEADMERRDRRDVYMTRTIDGMVLGGITLDPIGGSIVADEHARLEHQLFEADWAEANERLGREPKLHELQRTSSQRRADAMILMAVRSKDAPEDGRHPRPHFTVLVDFDTLHGRICQLANGAVIAPGSLLEWMDGATFERIVFAPGQRIECSPTSRFFAGATRRAIEVRDLECTHEYCDLPAERCQIDHIVPWNKGGETTQENGRVHCGFHNRLRNYGPPESGSHGPEPGG